MLLVFLRALRLHEPFLTFFLRCYKTTLPQSTEIKGKPLSYAPVDAVRLQ
jgi:hypothetical protein